MRFVHCSAKDTCIGRAAYTDHHFQTVAARPSAIVFGAVAALSLSPSSSVDRVLSSARATYLGKETIRRRCHALDLRPSVRPKKRRFRDARQRWKTAAFIMRVYREILYYKRFFFSFLRFLFCQYLRTIQCRAQYPRARASPVSFPIRKIIIRT